MKRDPPPITSYFGPASKSQKQILAELPPLPPKTICFHSYSKSDGHSYLSNLYPCVRFPSRGDVPKQAPFVDGDEREYDSVERYYQYHRYLSIDATYASEVILAASDAKAVASAAGKKSFLAWKKARNEAAPLSADSFQDRDEVMSTALRLKFSQNPKLREALVGTGNSFLEEQGRFEGEYWTNKGQNKLGGLLMELRDELRDSE